MIGARSGKIGIKLDGSPSGHLWGALPRAVFLHVTLRLERTPHSAQESSMMARRAFGRVIVVILAGVASVLALVGCAQLSSSFRYRMRVEGAVSGVAVYEIKASRYYGMRLPEQQPDPATLKGEALVMETPDGPIFVLLSLSRSGQGPLSFAVLRAFYSSEDADGKAIAKRLGKQTGIKAELPREDWPMMVRFRDINDPKSVERVSPADVGVTRIMLETTNDPMTTGIEKRLGWLGFYPEPTLNPKHGPKDFSVAAKLTHGDFRKGAAK
jgi:hypothetical protein